MNFIKELALWTLMLFGIVFVMQGAVQIHGYFTKQVSALLAGTFLMFFGGYLFYYSSTKLPSVSYLGRTYTTEKRKSKDRTIDEFFEE